MKFKSQVPSPKFQILYKILLYYSTILSTILIIGGFYTARSEKEVISNFLFLPIVIFLWIALIAYRKEEKSANSVAKTFGKKAKKLKIFIIVASLFGFSWFNVYAFENEFVQIDLNILNGETIENFGHENDFIEIEDENDSAEPLVSYENNETCEEHAETEAETEAKTGDQVDFFDVDIISDISSIFEVEVSEDEEANNENNNNNELIDDLENNIGDEEEAEINDNDLPNDALEESSDEADLFVAVAENFEEKNDDFEEVTKENNDEKDYEEFIAQFEFECDNDLIDNDERSIDCAIEMANEIDNTFIELLSDSICGNNEIELGEDCDDGNILDFDGCDSVCQNEIDY